MPETTDARPAIDGWWSTDDADDVHLIGGKCPQCATYVFPPREHTCPNPACESDTLELVPMSQRGTVWSYTENHYAPPPPFPAADPFRPYAIAAVQLAEEGLIVLGKVVEGTGVDQLRVGATMELTVERLYTYDAGTDRTVYAWRLA